MKHSNMSLGRQVRSKKPSPARPEKESRKSKTLVFSKFRMAIKYLNTGPKSVYVHGIESHGIDSHGIDSCGIESRGIESARFRIPVISTATAKMCIISIKQKFYI